MMKPFINWAGSRDKDIDTICQLVPKDIGTFVDPFVGDGACYLAVKANNYALADKNQDLIDCWRTVQTGGPRFRSYLDELVLTRKRVETSFGEINDGLLELKHSIDNELFNDRPARMNAVKRIVDKLPYEDVFRTKFTEPLEFQVELRHQIIQALEQMDAGTDRKTVELLFYTAFKAAVFQYLVEVYNKPDSKNSLRSALLIFLMEFARADKFVLDAGGFRPEYGGRKVNDRDVMDRKITAESKELADKLIVTKTYCQNIFRSLGFPFAKSADSFLFLDIPKELKEAGRKRLSEFLMHDTKARWMVICPSDDSMAVRLKQGDSVRSSIPVGKEVILMNY